jgi:hypothetical protein
MITLTYPGEYHSVCPNGRAFQGHLKAYRKRLERYLKRFDSGYSCLWFLEFQERGAPHVHMLMWGIADVKRDSLRKWSSRAWASIVGHSDRHEFDKHLSAGSSIQKMRKKHFGYAAKYASKTVQKSVPEGFADVGRFWGYWNFERPPSEVLSLRLDDMRYESFVEQLLQHVLDTGGLKSMRFFQRLWRLLERKINGDGVITCEPSCNVNIFGTGARKLVASFI